MSTTAKQRQALAPASVKTAFILGDAEVWPNALEDALASVGLEVAHCGEMHEMFEAARATRPSLIVLASREAASTVRACRVIRELEDVPIIVVMAREGDLIQVLDAGADDAVVSRVDPAIFVARVRALLRRTQPSGRSAGTLIVREMVIDLEKYQVSISGRPLQLTPTEFRLLAVLAQQAGRVVDPRALLSAVHQHDYSERDAQNLVKVHIANLRRKMNDSRSDNPYILCVRGFGYMLERRSQARENDPLQTLIEADS